MSLADVQRRLGLSPDGVWGPKTEKAVTDALWGAVEPSVASMAAVLARQPFATRPIGEIIVHCTATPEGRDVSVETIRGWHKAQGWSDIGYHYVVHLDGSVDAGRPEARIGAHVMGHNSGTLGVVYVGGVAADWTTAKDTRTPAQTSALMALCRALTVKYPKIAKISGHNEYAAKACPSFDVRKDPLSQIV